MLPPTQVCLEELAAARDVDELLAAARTVRPVSPWVERGAGGLVLRIDLDGRGGGAPPGTAGPVSGTGWGRWRGDARRRAACWRPTRAR